MAAASRHTSLLDLVRPQSVSVLPAQSKHDLLQELVSHCGEGSSALVKKPIAQTGPVSNLTKAKKPPLLDCNRVTRWGHGYTSISTEEQKKNEKALMI